MTIDEMTETFEALCVVHSEVGADAGADYPATDMTRAPTNERYLRVTSGGIRDIGEPIPLWFTDPDHAMFQWLNEAKACIEDYGKQLYWRDKPELVSRTFFMHDAGANVGDWRTSGSTSVEMHCVVARLLLSRLDPDGIEVEL